MVGIIAGLALRCSRLYGESPLRFALNLGTELPIGAWAARDSGCLLPLGVGSSHARLLNVQLRGIHRSPAGKSGFTRGDAVEGTAGSSFVPRAGEHARREILGASLCPPAAAK